MKRFAPWSLWFVAAVMVSAILSVVFEGRQASRAALRYVDVWETEIARSLLMHERTDEVAKLLAQIEEFHPSLKVAVPGDRCSWPVSRSISLYALPAAEVVVCRDTAALVAQGLLSPFFFGWLSIVLAVMALASRREHRQELGRLAAEARAESESRLGRLAREVAHDIRGPLSALQTLASRGATLAAAEKELLTNASSRIAAIADDLLDRSRKSEVSVSAAPLDDTVASLKTELEGRFAKHRLDFSLQAESAKISDGPALARALSNLVQNAAEASPDGAVIRVATRESSEAVTVIVSDEGRGIPAEILARLGREEISAGKAKGNGLGVLSAKRTVESLGGTFTIRSREGVGTQIEMRFPR